MFNLKKKNFFCKPYKIVYLIIIIENDNLYNE